MVESTCQGRRREFDPRSRKIPHTSRQLSPCTTTPELTQLSPTQPQLLSPHTPEPVHHDKRSHSKETPGGRSDEPQSTMTREGPHTATDSSTVKVIF